MEAAYKTFDDSDESPVKDADDFQDYLLKNTFISCWHANFDENMVMWEIYGQDNNAVAVQTTIGRMKQGLDTSGITGHALKLDNVSYVKAEEVPVVLLYQDCFFRKRPHFAFEREVRISLDTYMRDHPSKKTPLGYMLPTNINVLIESILVHPDSEEWFVDVVKSIGAKYGVQAPVERGSYGTK